MPIVADDRVHGPGQRGAVAYQLTRFAAYAAFGALFGAFGHTLNAYLGVTGSKLLPYLLVTLLVLQAFDLRWPSPPSRAVAKLARFRPRDGAPLGAFIGAITPLIPCGFLYSTIPLAIAAGTAASGATLLAAFALGTAPALIGVSLVPLKKVPALRRVALVAAAAFVLVRVVPEQPAGSAPCHHEVASEQ